MEKIKQYYRISNINNTTISPYYAPSKSRIILNKKELELYYNDEFGTYFELNVKGSSEFIYIINHQ